MPDSRQNDWMAHLPLPVQSYLEGHRLDEVECVIADLPGIARGKAVPASKFARQSHFHLPNSIYFQTITGGWGEAAGENGFTEPDMVLKPDMDTTTAAPWTGDWTLQVIHDACDQDGAPVPFAPRNVLKRVVDLYRKEGWEPVVAPEMEFYLVARNRNPAHEIEPMMGRSGRPAAARQAYSMSAVDEFGPVIDDIYDFAEAQGFEIDGITQEGGAGQLEINLRHGDPVKLADEIFYFKRLIREAALRHDCFATFMAKPIAGEPGSAMHIHHSVMDCNRRARTSFHGWRAAAKRLSFSTISSVGSKPTSRPPPSPCSRLTSIQLPPLRERPRGTHQPRMGPRQPHHRASASPSSITRRAPGGKPDRGHGLQPLSRHRRLAGLRLSRSERGQEALETFRK